MSTPAGVDSAPTIKAIPTQYKGFRCRSRLEARWIIFFETMRFDFWYEPEGFEFSDGTRYLPDFYFPVIRMYGEVKAERLCHATGKRCVFLIGPPDFKTYDALYFYEGDLEPTDVCLDIEFRREKWYLTEHRLFASCGGHYTEENHFTETYKQAVYAARAARFEGGANAPTGDTR